jgi:hypothetical protein
MHSLHKLRGPISKIEMGTKTNDMNMIGEGLKELRKLSQELWVKCMTCDEKTCVGKLDEAKETQDGYG